MTEGYIIKKLRKAIPEMKCKITCSDCCGPIPFSKWEWDQVKDQRYAQTIDCPYITPIGCSIYDDRPIICRLYGVIEKLKCPHGYKPKEYLTENKRLQINRIYFKLLRTGERSYK